MHDSLQIISNLRSALVSAPSHDVPIQGTNNSSSSSSSGNVIIVIVIVSIQLSRAPKLGVLKNKASDNTP